MTGVWTRVRSWLMIVVIHAAVIALWHGIVVIGEIGEFIMPTPVAAFQTLFAPDYHWARNTLVTASEIFGGYVLGVATGVAMALVFFWFRVLNATVMPLVVSLNMIPKVALAPLFIVWFSYGIGSNIIIAFSICFFPILLTTARGLREVEPDLIDLVRALKASRWQIFVKIQLPGSLPYIFSGMKVGAILAVAGAIVGEFRRLPARPRQPDDPGPEHARYRGDVHGRDPDQRRRRGALWPGADPRAHCGGPRREGGIGVDEELVFLSAQELVARYRDGSLSPVEATRATLDRDRGTPGHTQCLLPDRRGSRDRGRARLGGALARRRTVRLP